MDIRVKLWMYSPTSEYQTISSDETEVHDTLVEWRDESTPPPTEQDLVAAEAAYRAAIEEGPVSLSVDTDQIQGDGVDQAVVTVDYRLSYPDSIPVLVNGQEVSVDISEGPDTLIITSKTPGITVEISTLTQYQGVPANASVYIQVL